MWVEVLRKFGPTRGGVIPVTETASPAAERRAMPSSRPSLRRAPYSNWSTSFGPSRVATSAVWSASNWLTAWRRSISRRTGLETSPKA